MSGIEPSDNESVESGKSSPSGGGGGGGGGVGGHSPLIVSPPRSTSVPTESQVNLNKWKFITLLG